MASTSSADWSRIEFEYCDNEDSIREIADRHGISEGAIRKRAKAGKWVRAVRTPKKCVPERSPAPPALSDPESPVDAATIADGGRGLVRRMLDELDVITSRRGELENMIIEATDGDDEDARRDGVMRAVSLPVRANTMKTLALALKTLNEASAPQGKKAQQQEKADQVANRFRGTGPPTLKAVK
jgi:hypothetical protein